MDLTHVRFSGTPLSPLRSALRQSVAAVASIVTGPPAAALAKAGLDPLHYRAAPLHRRTPSCIRMLRSGTDADVLSSVLIGYTGFFRDTDVFDTVERLVVPQWGAARRGVRILSVGCSSGQELYSVAMLLAEHGLLSAAELVGVDCRTDAIRSAREGVFSHGLASEVPVALRSRYFAPAPGGVRIVEPIRARTRWRVMDATVELPAGPWDLILCRNLFIYLQQSCMAVMLTRMVDQLTPQGVLVVGKAERPPASSGLKPLGRCIYTRHAV